MLGIPTVVDRRIQQALLQVLQADWDTTFSDHSYGFRPGRSAHHAITRAQDYLHKGYAWVVDLDLEKFFDRVNHDKLMSLVETRIKDRRVITLIHRYLKSGVFVGEEYHETPEGTPQGARFHHCLQICNIYGRTARSGRRVMASVTEYLRRKLRLSVNEAKSAVDRPWKRTFLGFSFTGRRK